MKRLSKRWVFALFAVLFLSSLFLVSVEPALAKTKFFFGLNVGVPVTPYPVYAYHPPAPVYYAPVYLAYPPCARVWTPGYYDPHGNWVFGYHRHVCGPYGY
ncbi:hypothetical protein MELA_01351 [Candidatus Methylomirabilis lanthanidiphila]|uniref:Uncharacterized protein n=1 Tax=Candidatus Methylomirabilis lanthanidiphila TaxID=2211376 RepID=A0A564ZIR2_9BACT|nr:hypothetical protein [Candidatus Methylomirabilis lanthanidiphila]VUZ84976.1 hypothetical protein MELA_01351 [Candidatus Methylomirabilis lanthanidiphila]